MKRRDRTHRPIDVARAAMGGRLRRPAPIGLASSLMVLIAVGVVGTAADSARAGDAFARGNVPTQGNYTGGSGIGSITTNTTATGQWTTINQTQRTAIGNFNYFNIKSGSGVTVNQADSGYRLLARIADANPTVIQGSLQATGQVYLLNRNGILFDQGAQVNVGTLLASTLNISDDAFTKGFDTTASGGTNAFTRFDLFKDADGKPLPSAAVQVAAGATLNAASTGSVVLIAPAVENNGIITAPDGQVILAAGKSVYLWQRNTESGTAQAGALRGLMVEITAGDSDINLSSLVASSATNNGTITADRGNVSIAALSINQNGIVSAGSSVVSNGSIWLTARSVVPSGTTMVDSDDEGQRNVETGKPGTVRFGAGSVTGTPLLDDSGRLSHSDSYSAFTDSSGNVHDFRSWIHVVANKIDNAGTIAAPGGVIDLLARGSDARLMLEGGSTVSAAGDWVDKSVADNIIDITRLTSNELKDAPLQRSGALLGAAVSVDARVGSPLLDISGYIANRQETVQDKATVGGKITLEARQGEVISAANSTVDVSGGGIRYAGGSYTTTKLIGADGKLYDIGSASADREYIGTTTSGITRTYKKAGPSGWSQTVGWGGSGGTTRYASTETGYVEGASAGSLTVVAPSIVRQGNWAGGVTLGRYQVTQTDATKLPQGGTLTIGDSQVATGSSAFVNKVSFGDTTPLPADFGFGSTLPTQYVNNVVLPADEFAYVGMQSETYAYTGFANLAINANDSVTVPAGTTVRVAPGGSVKATTNGSGSITVEAGHDGLAAGAIVAPAGFVSLTSGSVTLGAGATLDTSGVVIAEARDAAGLAAAGGFTARSGDTLTEYLVNNVSALMDDMAAGTDRPASGVAAPRFAINAGSYIDPSDTTQTTGKSIAVDANAFSMGEGTTLKAMGGFVLGADNSVTAGKGGAISLPYTGTMPVDARLYGYSLSTGAKLAIDATASIRVGEFATGTSLMTSDLATRDLLVSSGIFNRGGFSDYSFKSSGTSLVIDAGTTITPQAQGLQVTLNSLAARPGATSTGLASAPADGDDGVHYRIAGGSGTAAVAADMTVREKGAGERTATSVHFSLSGAQGTTLALSEGAAINADPGATVEFAGSNLAYGATLDLLGSVHAAGGTINASLSTKTLNVDTSQPFDATHPDAETQSGVIHLGADAVLSTASEFVRLPGGSNAYGSVRETDGSVVVRERQQGYLTSGGNIALKADKARIVTDAGSTLDVSAAVASVDLPTAAGNAPYAAQQIWSDAGSISISSTEASRIDGKLQGQSAGDGLGGTLSVSFNRRVPPSDASTSLDRADFGHRLVVSQGTPDSDPRSAADASPYVTSRIAADTINAGGFANVTLKSDNSIEFAGPVQLATARSLTLDAPILDVTATGSAPAPAVSLTTDHLTLDNSSGNPWAYQATYVPVPDVATRSGSGSLAGHARLIDLVGSVTVNGVQGGTDAATGLDNTGLLLDASGDIRLTGRPVKTGSDASQTVDALVGRLTSEGNIDLRAQQVYPTTLSRYAINSQRVVDADPAAPGVGQTVTDSGTVRIAQASGTAQEVLSAGGSVAINAGRIVQGGTLKAPMGRIELSAAEVDFESGSLTSVSLDGMTVPLGETLDGKTWYYDLIASGSGTYIAGDTTTLTSVGDKQIVVNGETVNVKSGATVDLSGGGDVQAFEFVAGPGGSRDVLQTSASSPTWAILPSLRLTDAPVDTHLSARSGTTLTSNGYNIIYISGVSGIADGWYPLLDAHYALLPGAYQVSALTSSDKGNLVGATSSSYKTALSSSGYSNQLTALNAATYAGQDVPLGQDVPVGKVGTLLDGSTVISAWRGVAGTGVREARTSGYVIRTGTAARQYSQFNLTDSSYFATLAENNGALAPRLPTDAGGLTLKPSGELKLDGTLRAEPASGGRAAEVDITADLLAVVDKPGDAATQLVLATELSGLPADAKFVEIAGSSLEGLEGSVLLGGSRSSDGKLTAAARRVVVATGSASPLRATEILLAAKDQVTVADGAVIQADLPGTTSRSTYATTGDGALLRASANGQMTLDRSGTSLSGGTLDIRSGATVIGNSVLADATGTTRVDGALLVGKLADGVRSGGALSLSAKSVVLGDAAAGSVQNELQLDNAKLAALNSLDELAILSYSGIDLAGSAKVGSVALSRLTLDAPELNGVAGSDGSAPAASIAARTVTLRNGTGTARAATSPDGAGTLDVAADRVVLGSGDKGIGGFAQVNVVANTELAQSGTGTLSVAGTTRITTPRVVGSSGADQTLTAASYDGKTAYALDVTQPETVAASRLADTAATPGGKWNFTGKSVSFGSHLDAPAGAVAMTATGADAGDDVLLKSGTVLGVGGYARKFTDATAYASAGSVDLVAQHGNVTAEAGSTIDVSAATGGGDAGRIVVAAAGTADLAGTVSGSAPAGKAGSVSVDATTIADFSDLNERLNAGGLTGSRNFRQRSGNVDIAAGTSVKAGDIVISADAGDIDVNGTVDASGASGGGRVALYAQRDLNLNDGGSVDVSGKGTGTSSGGSAELVAETGRLNFAGGATVDVSAGGAGDAGSVTFASARDATGNWVNAPTLAGTVKGTHAAGYAGPKVVLRGDRAYDFATSFAGGTDATGTEVPAYYDASLGGMAYTAPTDANFTTTSVYTDYAAFADNAAALKAGAANLKWQLSDGDSAAGALSTAAGIELRGTNMTLASALDLTDLPTGNNWLKNGVAGMFTLRASGNLDIANSIGLVDYLGTGPSGATVLMDRLPKQDGWSLRLVAGADTTAANPLAVSSQAKGTITLQDDGAQAVGKVRTGTGSIEMAASGDLVFKGDNAVVYSAGLSREDATDPYSRYTSGGGDIRIEVGGDITGALKPTSQASTASGEFINDWLRRTTEILSYQQATFPAASWWSWRPSFKEGVASFGGGDIEISAKGSISNLGVMSPTSGRGNIDGVNSGGQTTLSATSLTVRGGGDVAVAAGQDIVGGEFLVGLGKGSVRAGGAVGTETDRTALFLMGQASAGAPGSAAIGVEAGGDVVLQNISNPTILASSGQVNIGMDTYDARGNLIPELGFGDFRYGFFTYNADSAATVVSVGGNVELGGRFAVKPMTAVSDSTVTDWSAVAPPSLTLAALTGDIRQRSEDSSGKTSSIDLFPSTTGGLKLLAGGDLVGVNFRDLNVDPAALPAWDRPLTAQEAKAPGTYGEAHAYVSLFNYQYSDARLTASAETVTPRFVADAGNDITGVTLITPAATTVRAGQDIKGSVLVLQNLAASDTSVIAAGRDIVQDAADYLGDVPAYDGNLVTTTPRILFGGPGTGIVEAGRNIDLADSKGIVADGNTRNASLNNSSSARLLIVTGVTGSVSVSGIDALTSATRLFGLMEDGNSAAMARDAKSAIQAASGSDAASLDALDATLKELAEAGRTKDIQAAAKAARTALATARTSAQDGHADVLAAVLSGLTRMSTVDTTDGSLVNTTAAAIVKDIAGVVFAGNVTGPGTLDLSKTQVLTTGGSQIDIIAPGLDAAGNGAGVVNVGLPSGAGENKSIGVVTQTGGAINAYVTGDLNVNQSKVLTSQGGDIMLYSAEGSIDAGRGALTSRSSSPPRRVATYVNTSKDSTHPNYEFTGYVYLPPIDVAGSGIRTVTSDPDGPGPLTAPAPGSVFLFAPKGTIDAGEAGIASAGDVTLRAVQVLNANAISAAGSSSGVPQTTISAVGALGTTATNVNKSDDLMKNLLPPSFGGDDTNRPRILMVEVLGTGDDEEVRIERKSEKEKDGDKK